MREVASGSGTSTAVTKTKIPPLKGKNGCNGVSASQPAPKIPMKNGIQEAINIAITTARQLNTGPKFRNQLVRRMTDYLKEQFLDLEDDPLELDVILKAIDEDNIADSLKTWLQSNAATISKRLKLEEGGKFSYVPPLPCRDKNSLMALLREYNYKCYGGIYRTDIESSIPNSEMVLRSVESEIFTITGPDKVQVVFYNDRSLDLGVSPFVMEVWNSTDNPDMETIIERLIEDGQSVMETWTCVVPPEERPKKIKKKREFNTLRDNKHVAHLLLEYPEDR